LVALACMTAFTLRQRHVRVRRRLTTLTAIAAVARRFRSPDFAVGHLDEYVVRSLVNTSLRAY